MTNDLTKAEPTNARERAPRVVFCGLASCFGCQINITNNESNLMDVLGQIDTQYWQLTSSDPMPTDFDVAVIEGAVTTSEAEASVHALREAADVVITIGACAATAGIPGMAARAYDGRQNAVYGEHVPEVISSIAYEPRAVRDVIDVDFEVPCCPVEPSIFVNTLQHALYGSNIYRHSSTLCGECKGGEHGCFYGRGIMCMGLVTRSGCGAKCTKLGRPCNGCAGLSPDANLDTARVVVERAGINLDDFEVALQMFNQRNDNVVGHEEVASCTSEDEDSKK
jgi:coenzyme F420-reducing hydrogenase gamma subunit